MQQLRNWRHLPESKGLSSRNSNVGRSLGALLFASRRIAIGEPLSFSAKIATVKATIRPDLSLGMLSSFGSRLYVRQITTNRRMVH
jgi:hypothetical protein